MFDPVKTTAYDYHDYTNSNILSKMFDRYQRDDVVYEEIWTIYRPVTGLVERTEKAYHPGSDPNTPSDDYLVRHVMNRFEATATLFKWMQLNSYYVEDDPLGAYSAGDLRKTDDYDPPVALLTNAMVPGFAWGTAGVVDDAYSTDGEYLDNYYTDKNEVLAVEDVTVPTGSYSDCLKIHRSRQYFGAYTRIEWHCPNMGLVKRVQGGDRLMEMTDVTFSQ